MSNLSIKLAIFGLFVAGVLLTACGGGGEAPAAGEEAPAAVTLDFVGEDISFDVESVSVTSGQEVTVNFQNAGTLEHSWVLVSDRIDPLVATEADALPGTNSGTIVGGEGTTLNFVAPGPGDYTFVCTVEGHAEAGMLGDFIVK